MSGYEISNALLLALEPKPGANTSPRPGTPKSRSSIPYLSGDDPNVSS